MASLLVYHMINLKNVTLSSNHDKQNVGTVACE